MSKSKKSNGSFVHQFLDLYSNKGAGFAMLLLYKHYKNDIKGINNVLPSLRKEGIKRKIDMHKLFESLNHAIGIDDRFGQLSADGGNEADQPKDEDGPSETRADDGSSGSREEKDK